MLIDFWPNLALKPSPSVPALKTASVAPKSDPDTDSKADSRCLSDLRGTIFLCLGAIFGPRAAGQRSPGGRPEISNKNTYLFRPRNVKHGMEHVCEI